MVISSTFLKSIEIVEHGRTILDVHKMDKQASHILYIALVDLALNSVVTIVVGTLHNDILRCIQISVPSASLCIILSIFQLNMYWHTVSKSFTLKKYSKFYQTNVKLLYRMSKLL